MVCRAGAPGIFVAVVCGIAWFAFDQTQPATAWKSFIPYWNLMGRTAVFLAVAFILSLVKALNEELETKVEQRTRELSASLLEHQLTEERLRESELRFRQVTESIREVFWVTDTLKNRMLYISPGYEETWGRSCESLYASPHDWIEAIHHEDRDRVRQAVLTKQLSGEYDEEYRIVRPDGAIRWIRDRAFPVRSDVGKVYRIAGIAEDITERKQAEAQVAMLAHAVESTSELICITDLQDRFIFVNRAFQKAHGYTEAEVSGKNPEILYSPRNPPSLLAEVIEQTRRGGWRGEVLDRRKDRTEFPVRLSTSLVRDRAGQVIGLMGVAQDITEHKLAEKSLRESRQQLHDILDNTTAVIYVKDRNGRFILVNRWFETLFHLTRDQIVGKTDFDLFSKEQAVAFRQNDLQVLATSTPFEFEEVAPHDDGLHTYISSKFPLFDGQGVAYAVCGISTDITERKRLEKEVLEVTYRERARIGQDIHDDLCQRLVSIAFSSNLLTQKLRERSLPEVQDAAEIARLLDDSITQARSLARMLYPVLLETGGLASALQELAANVTARSRIECTAVCQETVLIRDLSVATHIYRIAQEAVSNAVRHAQASRIVITLDVVDGECILGVTDNGIGLGDDVGRSAGMGLRIMQYRARMIDGRLEVKPGDCGGTRVTCFVPAGES